MINAFKQSHAFRLLVVAGVGLLALILAIHFFAKKTPKVATPAGTATDPTASGDITTILINGYPPATVATTNSNGGSGVTTIVTPPPPPVSTVTRTPPPVAPRSIAAPVVTTSSHASPPPPAPTTAQLHNAVVTRINQIQPARQPARRTTKPAATSASRNVVSQHLSVVAARLRRADFLAGNG